jgi:hypothetical protein
MMRIERTLHWEPIRVPVAVNLVVTGKLSPSQSSEPVKASAEIIKVGK